MSLGAFVALFFALVVGCAADGVGSACRANNLCGAGEVCISGACAQVCAADGNCSGGQICDAGACVAGSRGQVPTITSVDSDGTSDGAPDHAGHHLAHSLWVHGSSLSGVSVKLVGAVAFDLTVDPSSTDALLLAALPTDLVADSYTLVVANAAGSAQTGILIMQGEAGATGPSGPTGADGQLRIYGDGSFGSRTISATGDLEDFNLQYTDFTVNAGVTLTVPSGTVLRVQGTFTNNGTIVVGPGARGALYALEVASGTPGMAQGYVPAEAGISLRAAGSGQLGSSGGQVGGLGGVGLTVQQAAAVLHPGVKAGGGGGVGAYSVYDSHAGGGSFTVLAGGAIVNNGTIRANGQGNPDIILFCRGGGGGGVVILASRVSVSNQATIEAKGGAGDLAECACAAGGGGGGGLIHYMAPVISSSAENVEGGAGGAGNTCATAGLYVGGGGGGASFGNGGRGGTKNAPAGLAGTDGGPGMVLQSQVDPTAFF